MVSDIIVHRRSVRAFLQDPVGEEAVDRIIRAGQYAPSARHNAAVEFIVVRDQSMIAALYALIGVVQEGASTVIVPVTDTEKTRHAVEDLSVASENMFLEAVAIGLGTVWKHLSEERRAKAKALLRIPDTFTLINFIPVGTPAVPPPPHTDADYSAGKIHRERW